MARIFPEILPQDILDDPRRQAECTLYEELARQLDERWRVFYSVGYLMKSPGKACRNGEADFVIAHPDLGMLILECKGGAISCTEHGRWASVDRDGEEHLMNRSPTDQARANRYALEEHLKSIPDWGWLPASFGHAVAFPDCRFRPPIPMPELPSEIVIDDLNLLKLEHKLRAAMAHWADKGKPHKLSDDRLRLLEHCFAPRIFLPHSLHAQLRQDDREIIRLTDQQFQMLRFLGTTPRAAVNGTAGSGKTFLALEQARRLAAQGYRTLMTCFNRPLAEFLRACVGDVPNLVIRTYHHYCSEMAEKVGIPLEEPDRTDGAAIGRFWREDHTVALLRALEELPPSECFDAIIVDEAQDFEDSWWTSLQLALIEGDRGIIQVFYDMQQNIFHRSIKLEGMQMLGALRENLRSTKAIHQVIRTHFGADEDSCGPDGVPVEWVPAEDERTTTKAISKLLHRLINEERIDRKDIVILSGRSLDKITLGSEGVIGPFPIARESPDGRNPLLSTIHRFKGLDARCVILTELDTIIDRREDVLYVGLSRARAWLAIVGTSPVLAAIREQRAEGDSAAP